MRTLQLFPLVVMFTIGGCGADPDANEQTETVQQAVTNGGIFASEFDASANVRVSAFLCWNETPVAHPTVTCPVRSDFVVISGSAHTATSTPRGFLTASYPNSGLTSWTASSKDHVVPHPHQLFVMAYGMSVVGMTPDQLRQHLTLITRTSAVAAHPRLQASSVPSTKFLLGVGAKVNWTGAGNMLTGVWHTGVRAKDHLHSDPASITMYEIQIAKTLPAGRVDVILRESAGTTVSTGLSGSTVRRASGYAPAGAYGFAVYSGAGRLMTAYGYHPQRTATNGYETWTTDHEAASSGQALAAMSMIRVD